MESLLTLIIILAKIVAIVVPLMLSVAYLTFAEREADLSDFPPGAEDALPKQPFNQGSMVFTPPKKFEGDPNSLIIQLLKQRRENQFALHVIGGHDKK